MGVGTRATTELEKVRVGCEEADSMMLLDFEDLLEFKGAGPSRSARFSGAGK